VAGRAQLRSIQIQRRRAQCAAVTELPSPSLLSSLLAMASFALVGAITPGPVNVLALRHGSQAPRHIALLYVLGASVSYAAVVWCMGQGARQLVDGLPRLAGTAQWLCAAYLLWLAWRLARAAAHPAAADGTTLPHQPTPAAQAFIQGVAVQTLNPKAWLFALSAVGVFALPSARGSPAALYLLCAISLLACLLGVGCWALLGRVLTSWLSTPRRQQALHYALAALLVASVLGMLA